MSEDKVITENNEHKNNSSAKNKHKLIGDKRKVFEKRRDNRFNGKLNRKDKKFGNKFLGRNGLRDAMKDKDRISKRLAMLGVASRRDADKMVADGKVKINGVVCKDLGFLVSYEDKISVNNKEIVNKPIRTKIYTFNKPSGYVTTNNDPQGRKTIFELIPSRFGRLITIGRLDMNTEGLLLLTNNGELARIMEMPATGLKRIYYAKVVGSIDEKMKERLEGLRKGIKIEGTEYGKMIIEIESVSPTTGTLKIVIFEGKNNEIRRVMWHLGLKVVKLTRVQYGDFKLFGLPSGCISESRMRIDIRSLERRASINAKKYNERIKNIKDKKDYNKSDDVDEVDRDLDNSASNEEYQDSVIENLESDIVDDNECKCFNASADCCNESCDCNNKDNEDVICDDLSCESCTDESNASVDEENSDEQK